MLEWKSDTHLVVDDVDFTLAPTGVPDGRETARQLGGLLLRKARWMVERYAALVPGMESANIMELGIYDGGSTALLALMFHPKKLVACDLIRTRVAALDSFIETHDLSESVRAYYEVDQADSARLGEIVAAEFGSEPLDLVIDDASHLLDETTASFNVLFPRLRPGGVFVIEDWSWQHFRDETIEKALDADPALRAEIARQVAAGEIPAPEERAMSRLVLDAVLTAGVAEDVISEVTSLQRDWVAIRRGDADLDPSTFDIRHAYGALGRAMFADGA